MNTHRGQRRWLAGFLGVATLAGVACSAAPSLISGKTDSGPASGAVAPVAPAAAARAAQPAGAPASANLQSSAPAATPADAARQPGGIRLLDRMVIRTAKLSLQVDSVERALASVAEIARQGGGFIAQSNLRVERVGADDRPLADLTLQVRADALDASLQALRGIARTVEAESSTSQDVTEEYVDLEANLRNLQASEQAIVRLLDRAQKIEDVITLQRELTNVRGQIERIQGRKTFLERRSDLATITLSLRLPPVESRIALGGWDPASVARRAWEASLVTLASVANVAIAVVAYSWWLVPLIALAAYAVRRGRRSRGVTTAAV